MPHYVEQGCILYKLIPPQPWVNIDWCYWRLKIFHKRWTKYEIRERKKWDRRLGKRDDEEVMYKKRKKEERSRENGNTNIYAETMKGRVHCGRVKINFFKGRVATDYLTRVLFKDLIYVGPRFPGQKIFRYYLF
jgi:hypothetical protein